MVLALKYLQGYYASEIARGQQNFGNYHLRSEFSSSLAMTLFLPDSKVYSPTEIVLRIKENMHKVVNSPQTSDTSNDVGTSNLVLQDLSQKE